MLGKIVPRCIDTYGTVRQTAVNILKHILEIQWIYDTLTIPENEDWFKELDSIREDIGTDNGAHLYKLTEDISKIIADKLSHFQYVQFWWVSETKLIVKQVKSLEILLFCNFWLQHDTSESSGGL